MNSTEDKTKTSKEFITHILSSVAILATLVSPFGTMIYEALSEDDFNFLYEYRYAKNPVVEWNRQINAALKRLDESAKSADDLPKSLVQEVTKELAINMPILALWADIKPFDSMQVRIINISNKDIKNIRVQFLGCTGYDSHSTYPDSLASLVSPEALRKLPGPITIGYQKLARTTPAGISYNGYITFYGDDASQCKPQVTADLDNDKSAIGKFIPIDEYLQNRSNEIRRWEKITDITFKLGFFVFGLVIYFQVRSLKSRLDKTDV